MLRMGAGTGERMALVDGDPADVDLPSDVRVARIDEGGDVHVHAEVAGRDWRISGASFFQTSDAGAEALVDAVTSALHGSEGRVVDLYAGVGLLGGAVAADRLTTAVESGPSAVRDARHNLGSDVHVDASRVERWKPDLTYGTVIADPARAGLDRRGVAVVGQCEADHLALVSCDPASLGRDTALLIDQGWIHDGSVVIDMFPDTSRIEVVTRFAR